MLNSKTVLIVEGCAYGAIDLSSAVEACDGRVAGPVATASSALIILDSEAVAAAIVDCELSDTLAVVMTLADRAVPFVIQTSTPLPPALDFLDEQGAVLLKPVDSRAILEALEEEIAKQTGRRAPE